ncbi:MAG: hypothetical protein K6U03_02055 [Firmicutes bacterium]|nr:hypothetical protein [Bacillota bacterium]
MTGNETTKYILANAPALTNGQNVLNAGPRWRMAMHYAPADEYCEIAESATAAQGVRIGRIYDNGSGKWKAFLFSQSVRLKPGKWYRISVKARVVSNHGTKTANAYLSYNYQDAQSENAVTRRVYWSAAELAPGKWVRKYVIFQVPVGCVNNAISPYLYGHYGAGIVEYDDYRIEEFATEPTGPPTDEEKKEFTGKKIDAATGLVYFGARYYDPEVARWTTVDPLRVGNNWYEYCYNNPLRFVDQNGLWGKDIHRDWTYKAALAAGFSKRDAKLIAYGAFHCDDIGIGKRGPVPLLGDLSYHFDMNPDPKIDSRVERAAECFARARELVKSGKIDEGLIELGYGMHALQDIYAHQDYGPEYHLPIAIFQSLEKYGLGVFEGKKYCWLDDPYMEDVKTPTKGLSERALDAIELTRVILEYFKECCFQDSDDNKTPIQ